jgi:hypothetical protein
MPLLYQALTQLDKQGAQASELAYTMRPTSTVPLLEQGNQIVQGRPAQGTTIWHLLTFKPPQDLTITTTRTSSKRGDFSTLTNNCSMVVLRTR